MTDRPILFQADMVRAILAGSKTQTRRVVKPQPPSQLIAYHDWEDAPWQTLGSTELARRNYGNVPAAGVWHCPYGAPGDRLWVRETFRKRVNIPGVTSVKNILYAADAEALHTCTWDSGQDEFVSNGERWVPSIFMPRWASRITLEITDIRVQRVWDISEEDAQAEGVGRVGDRYKGYMKVLGEDYSPAMATTSFSQLWETINLKRGYPWRLNPWVWALTFKVVQ